MTEDKKPDAPQGGTPPGDASADTTPPADTTQPVAIAPPGGASDHEYLQRSIHDAELMMYYASHGKLDSSEEVEVLGKLAGLVTTIKCCIDRKRQPGVELVEGFYSFLTMLSHIIYPVTAKSLEETGYDSNDEKSGFGKSPLNSLFPWCSKEFSELRWIVVVTIPILAYTAFLSVFYFNGIGLIKDIDDSIKTSREIREKLIPLCEKESSTIKYKELTRRININNTLKQESLEKLYQWNRSWSCVVNPVKMVICICYQFANTDPANAPCCFTEYVDVLDEDDNETSEKLSKLPDKLKFPANLKDKIRFDDCQQSLKFKGVMSWEEKLALLKLSEDKPYNTAIESLFQRSHNENKSTCESAKKENGKTNDVVSKKKEDSKDIAQKAEVNPDCPCCQVGNPEKKQHKDTTSTSRSSQPDCANQDWQKTPSRISKRIEIKMEGRQRATILGNGLLLLLYGLLGSCAFIIRKAVVELGAITFHKPKLAITMGRLVLGAIAGFFLGIGASNDFFQFMDLDGGDHSTQAVSISKYSPLLLAFVGGYSYDLLFGIMNRLLYSITNEEKYLSIKEMGSRKPKIDFTKILKEYNTKEKLIIDAQCKDCPVQKK
jgi:hypothetical protein